MRTSESRITRSLAASGHITFYNSDELRDDRNADSFSHHLRSEPPLELEPDVDLSQRVGRLTESKKTVSRREVGVSDQSRGASGYLLKTCASSELCGAR